MRGTVAKRLSRLARERCVKGGYVVQKVIKKVAISMGPLREKKILDMVCGIVRWAPGTRTAVYRQLKREYMREGLIL